MKKYTILQNLENEIMLVSTHGIYDVVHLNTSEDGAYIYHKDTGEFEYTEGFFEADYFEVNTDERLVVRKDWAERYNTNLLREREITLDYEFEGEVEFIDVTDIYMIYTFGKAVEIEHGINTDIIVFDGIEEETEWSSIGECDAEVEPERGQDYPRQEATCLYHCDNGLVIREYCPFFADEQPTTFEVIKGNINNI